MNTTGNNYIKSTTTYLLYTKSVNIQKTISMCTKKKKGGGGGMEVNEYSSSLTATCGLQRQSERQRQRERQRERETETQRERDREREREIERDREKETDRQTNRQTQSVRATSCGNFERTSRHSHHLWYRPLLSPFASPWLVQLADTMLSA